MPDNLEDLDLTTPPPAVDGEPVAPKFVYGDDELEDVPPGWTFPKA